MVIQEYLERRERALQLHYWNISKFLSLLMEKVDAKWELQFVLDLDNLDHFALNHQYLEIEKYMVTKALKSWDIDLQLS